MLSKKLLALLMAAMLMLPAFALASEEFEGNVTAADTVTVTAPYGGTVKSIALREGALISAGDTVATMETTQALAPEDGTVRGIFAQVGDTLDKATVLYLSPVSKYTITCSIGAAYPDIDNTYVRIGETVYIKCKPDGTHKAVGVITAVDGSNFTVQTTGGELYLEETVYIYRSDAYTYASRIGSGTVGRTAELAVTGSGSLLSLAVADGDSVERGQLLFETVDGTVDPLANFSANVTSDVSGVIAAIKVAAGDKVSKGDVLLTVYQQNSYIIEFSVDEDLLGTVKTGDTVNISFHWNEDDGQTVQGTVTGISYVSEASSATTDTTATSSTQYTGYARFTADDTVRLGMSVTVTTTDD